VGDAMNERPHDYSSWPRENQDAWFAEEQRQSPRYAKRP
jgi:hypothetical protein